MTVIEARRVVVPIGGKHRGRALGDVCETDAGLLWLDFMMGTPYVTSGGCRRKYPEFDDALRVLHAHHAQEIESLLRD